MTSLIFASSVALLSVTVYSFPSSIYLCPRQRDPEGYHCSIPMSIPLIFSVVRSSANSKFNSNRR